MKRRTPPAHLTEAFYQEAMSWYFHGEPGVPEEALRHFDGGPACWLYQFDPLERRCSGELQAIHLISKQRIRNLLKTPLLGAYEDDFPGLLAFTPEEVENLVELIEWDPRNAAPGCSGHHPRFDSQRTPRMVVPASALRPAAVAFIHERGLDLEADRKFAGAAFADGVAAQLQEQPRQEAA